MATKQMIVAICLTAAILLSEAQSARQKKATNPDADLTTVRQFYFILHDKLSERGKRFCRWSYLHS